MIKEFLIEKNSSAQSAEVTIKTVVLDSFKGLNNKILVFDQKGKNKTSKIPLRSVLKIANFKKFFCLCLIVISTFDGFAQQKPSKKLLLDTTNVVVKTFSLKQLNAYKGQKDFNYSQKNKNQGLFTKLYFWFKRVVMLFLNWLFGVEKATGVISTFFKALPYFILLLCLFVITKFFVKINMDSLTKKSIAKKGDVIVFDDEKLMKSKNLDDLLTQAIAENNFRLAIRYEYLKILKHLADLDLIDWQLQKTNEDYYSEISQVVLKPLFKQSTLLYDYIWYGNFKIDRNHYAKIKIILDEFLNKMNQFDRTK